MTVTTRCMLSAVTLLLALGACTAPGASQAKVDPNTPGWTGSTVVIGNNSTIAGAAEGTYNAQKWGIPSRR